MLPDRGDDLIADYLDGRLEPEAAAAFRDRVVSDPELARALFVAAVDEAFLRIRARGEGESRPKAAGRRPPLRGAGRVAGVAAMAASLLFACWAMWPSAAVEPVANVERLTACEWSDGVVPSGPVSRGQSFKLRTGVAEFVTRGGVRTVFEGPAAFQFEGAGVVRLTSGRLFCDVPKGAEGFSVQTANGRVVDLGTRFGVEIDSGGETEVHVTAGRVRAEISDSVTRQELHAGQAGRFRSGGAAVTLVPYQRAKFATASGLIYEPFNYPPRLPLVGQGGWFDRDATLPLPNIGARDIRPYPPLPEPRGRGLELNRAAGRASRPVGRPWPAPFASSLVWIDDDFIRGMRPSRGGAVGLLGFGQPDPAGAAVRLVVKPGTRDANFGLQTGEQTLWCPRACKHHETHFVVLETGRSAARLWVNPSPVAFEADGPPPADVEVPFPAPPKVGTLWIGQPGTPAFAWWQVAELRGGYSWADVTPRTAGQ